MAMNDDLDELVSLYAHAARETPSPQVDARILAAADRVASTRRMARHLAWPSALAASVLLWAAFHASAPRPYQATPHDLQLRAELAGLDVAPARSDVTAYLAPAVIAHDSPVPENQP